MNMKKFFAFAIVATISFCTMAQLKPSLDPKKESWGLLKEDGKYAVKPQFDEISETPEGFIVRKKDKWGFLNNEGKRAVKFDYQKLINTPDYYLLAQKDGKWGVVSKDGNTLLKPIYDTMTFTERHNLCVTLGGRASIIKADGSIILPAGVYTLFEPLGRGLLLAHEGTAVGLIDEQGKELVEPGKYDSFSLAADNSVAVTSKNKKGFLRLTNGTIKHSGLYDSYESIGNGLIRVKNNGKSGIATSEGTEIIPTFYDEVYLATHPRQKELIMLVKNGMKGWASRSGIMAEPQFQEVAADSDNGGDMMVRKDGYRYPTDFHGNSIFSQMRPIGTGLRQVSNDTVTVRLVDKNFNTVFHADSARIEPLGNIIAVMSYIPNTKNYLLDSYGKQLEADNIGVIFSSDSEKKVAFFDPEFTMLYVYDFDGHKLYTPSDGSEPPTELGDFLKEAKDFVAENVEEEPEEVVEEVIEVVEDDSPVAWISKVWVSHNVFQGNVKGMKIHVKFNINHCLGVNGSCVAWFYFSDGTRLNDYDGYYKTTDGQVSTSAKICPNYEYCVYNDCTMFIPYAQLHLTQSQVSNCMFKVGVFAGGTQLATSDPEYFNFTPAGLQQKSTKKSTKKKRR